MRLVGFVPDVDRSVTVVEVGGHSRAVPVVNNVWTVAARVGVYSVSVRDAAGARSVF